MIPQTDPRASYLAQQAEIDEAVRRVMEGGWYILGNEVKAFEAAFAGYIGVSHGVGVANGTDAVELALRACGVGTGDAVFTVSHTAVATVVAVERTGAKPVFVDIDPVTYTMDPNSLDEAVLAMKRAMGPETPKAIVAVHLYGHPADLTSIREIAHRHDLLLIEDCAQAHGAKFEGKRLGSFGAAAAFSFYPTKNLGAIGDGGAVVTNDAAVAERLRMLREYGWRHRYVSEISGMNSRLDELQAAILAVKLRVLDAGNAQRRRIAEQYTKVISGTKVTLPISKDRCEHVYHQYVIRTSARDPLREHLKSKEIGTLVHYPVPIHLQPAYQGRIPLLVPVSATEKAAREVLSLPIFPELQPEHVQTVARAVAEAPMA